MVSLWRTFAKSLLAIALAIMSATLQGCFLGHAFSHPTPSWMDYAPYWTLFQYIPEGATAKKAIYNSCLLNLPTSEQCSGHGECKAFRPDLNVINGAPTKFCKCFRDWADPECRTKRKSQMTAYFLSIFGGYLGLDRFYLGLYYSGFAKLATLGLGGLWYVYDVVRIGSAPVYAADFRVAYDLPHWLYVIFTVGFFSILGYIIFGYFTVEIQKAKQNKKLLMAAADEFDRTRGAAFHINPEDRVGNPTFASYSTPLPGHSDFQYYGAVPPEVLQSGTPMGQFNPYSPYAVWKHATRGYRPSPPYLDARMRPAVNCW
mmetsp:Transcript_63945/g.101411  ORF Transcript_63945/g.101411 Transcript_63945/m.101411 type:complete len:316 (+) Transcript_63945:108-1055(+)